MIEGTKPFNQVEMYKLCRGSEKHCNFDLSSISMDVYYQFFTGLPNFIYKKVRSVRFSLDLYHKYDDTEIDINDRDQEILDFSIHANKRKFTHYLFKIINKTLPRSRTITNLEIDGFRIPSKYFDDFVDAVKKCRSLQSIKIDNSLLNADQFLRILDYWSPYQFTSLSFVNDNLQTTQVAPEISIFLNKTGKRTWKLQTLNLSENGFTKDQIASFNKLIKNRLNPSSPPLQEEPPLDEGSEVDEDEEYTHPQKDRKTNANTKHSRNIGGRNKQETLSLDEKEDQEEEEEEEEIEEEEFFDEEEAEEEEVEEEEFQESD